MGTIARMAVELGMDASGFERGIANVQNSLDSMAKKMASAGTTLSLGVTAPLAGIATMALQSAGDFEQSLNIMAQVSGATADQMATLEAQALNMGAVTAFSAGEAAQAQLELAKAGLSVNDIIAATPGVLDMAAAGGMGLAESAEIAANAMNAFNLPASEMPGIANMLAAAANASSVDITDLSAAMKMSGAVFASNKQPMDDMVTALAMLGNAGLKGSDAGTSLKTMMMSLAAPTDAAYAALTNMNVAAYDSAGNMRGFSDILSDLAVATAGMSDEQRNAALSTIFGSDAIRAASILTRDYGQSWDGISDALGDGSAATKVAGARMKGIAGAVEYFKGSLDSFLIGSALPYLDMVGNMIRSGADLVTSFGSIPAPIQQAVIAFGAVLAAAGPVMLAISGIATALGFLLSPIGLIVVGVATLAAAWVTNFGGIQQKTQAMFNALQPVFKELQKWFDLAMKGDFSGLQGEIGNAINSVKVAVQNFKWSDFITSLTDWGVYVTSLAWDTIVTTFGGWATYITSIDWGTYITTTLSDWGAYVTSLDWGGFVTTWAGWATKIATLQWNLFVTAISWAAYIDQLVWDNYLSKIDWGGIVPALLDWGTYVTKLAWSDYIVPLWTDYIVPLVWDNYLAKLDWNAIGLTVLDWATWIPAIAWEMFISPIRWGAWIVALVWNNIINPVNWKNFLPTLLSWNDYLSKLEWNLILNPVAWGVYIGTLDWGSFLPVKFVWTKFIEKVNWLDHVPVLTWPTFDVFKWGDFVEVLAWPKIELPKWSDFIPDLTWPTIKAPKWEDFIPDISWPSIPAFPGWVEILAALGFGKSIPGAPAGTGQNPATQPGSGTSDGAYGQPGANVDINPPYPTADVPGTRSRRLGGIWDDLMANTNTGPMLNIENFNAASEIDVHALAYQVAAEINRWRR